MSNDGLVGDLDEQTVLGSTRMYSQEASAAGGMIGGIVSRAELRYSTRSKTVLKRTCNHMQADRVHRFVRALVAPAQASTNSQTTQAHRMRLLLLFIRTTSHYQLGFRHATFTTHARLFAQSRISSTTRKAPPRARNPGHAALPDSHKIQEVPPAHLLCQHFIIMLTTTIAFETAPRSS